MSNFERRGGEHLPVARPIEQQPGVYLRTGDLERVPAVTRHDTRVDRRNESRHIVAVRELQRQAIEGAAVEARNAFIDAAAIEAGRRTLTEAKFQLHRARKESQILAGEDLELKAKFAQLDDDFFAYVRWVGVG